MRKELLIAGLAAVALGLGVAIYFALRPGEKSGETAVDPRRWDVPMTSSEELLSEVYLMFDEGDEPSFEKFMKDLKSGKLNLVWELWRLRRLCPQSLDHFQCNSRILVYLREKYPEESERIARLVQQYLQYEDRMSEFEMPGGLTLMEKYELTRKKRRDVFSEEEASLIFGMEEATVHLNQKTREFFQESASLTGDKRVQAYEELRKKTMGQYYPAFLEDEPSFARYESEIALREGDLKAVAGHDQASMTHAIRERYFGSDGAARMAAVEAGLKEEGSREQQYEEAERKFLSENAAMSPEQKEAGLAKLRVQLLGEEAGAAYARRRQYREAMAKLDLTP